MSHFAQRARERGYTGDTDALFNDLCRAFELYDRLDPVAHEFVELVRTTPTGARIFRFRTPDGFLFAVEADHRPMTVLTKAQVDFYKAKARKVSRSRGPVKKVAA